MDAEALRVAFVEALPDPLRSEARAWPGLGSRLVELAITATSAHPDLDFPLAEFVGYVAARLDPQHGLTAGLDRVRAGDLFLAGACAAGDDAAATRLDELFHADLHGPLAQLRLQAADRDDLVQVVRERLLVGADAPAIARYNGAGPLGRWLRVTAMRAGLNARRAARADAPSPAAIDADHLGRALGDPELDFLRQRYTTEFRDAIVEAVASLGARPRRMLRLSVQGLTVREIGRMYGVHYVTAARNIRSARDRLVQATHGVLKARLRLTSAELQSVIALVRSRLDLSVARALESDG